MFMNPSKEDFEQLRESFDGNDPIMRGLSVSGRPRSGHQARVANIGENEHWAHSNTDLHRILTTAFPSLASNPLQRKKAGTWLRIIALYYRGHLGRTFTAADVARQLGTSQKHVEDTLRRIRRVAKGLRTDGNPRAAKRGRRAVTKPSDVASNQSDGKL